MSGDTLVRAVVGQDSYVAQSEGNVVGLRANPRGEIIVPDWFTQLALDGRVFNISTSVQETGDLLGETSPGANNVNPSILVDVPTGTTIIPIELTLCPEGTGTTGDWSQIRMSTDDKVRWSAGGATITPINMRKDDPQASNCSAYHGGSQITALGNTDDDTIWYEAIDTSAYVNKPVRWSARDGVPPILIGPASLLVFLMVSNVDEEVLWSLKWAEMPTVNA